MTTLDPALQSAMVKDAILLPPNAARGAGPAAGAIALALVVLLAVKTWHPRHDAPGAVVSDSLISAAGGGASSFIDGSSPQSAQPHRDESHSALRPEHVE